MSNFSLASTVKHYPTTLPFAAIKDKILGKRYELSLVFVGPERAATLNRTYRHKTYSPNVLSFPLDATAGEIFICPAVTAREAAKFNLSKEGYITFLFIHGCLHLKGYDHGDTMEELERKFCKAFKVT